MSKKKQAETAAQKAQRVGLLHPLEVFEFGEAFRLMMYVGEETGRAETLWNSRDGVTPFTIPSLQPGETMVHSFFNADINMPFFIPPVGMRIFTTLSEERAAEFAQRRVNVMPRSDLDNLFGGSSKKALAELTGDIYGSGEEPDIRTVTEAMHEKLGERAHRFCKRYWAFDPTAYEVLKESV